jgi:hypothetical protein
VCRAAPRYLRRPAAFLIPLGDPGAVTCVRHADGASGAVRRRAHRDHERAPARGAGRSTVLLAERHGGRGDQGLVVESLDAERRGGGAAERDGDRVDAVEDYG